MHAILIMKYNIQNSANWVYVIRVPFLFLLNIYIYSVAPAKQAILPIHLEWRIDYLIIPISFADHFQSLAF